jgi:hypothetical protein
MNPRLLASLLYDFNPYNRLLAERFIASLNHA